MKEKLTQKDVEKIQQEIDHRKLVVRKEAIEAVKEARAQGDLSENFEYYAAKKHKNQNESRIRYLERMLKTATVVDDSSKSDEVGMDVALCNFLFTVLRSIKQFFNIFQLHPWLHGFSVNSISKIYSCRILMVKFGQQIFGQFPKLFLHRMVIIRQTAERNLFFLHIQKNIFRAKYQLFRIQKKLCHFFYYMEKSFQNHFQIFSLQFTLFVKRCQRLL